MASRRVGKNFRKRAWALLALLLAAAFGGEVTLAATFTVDSTADASDANPGDGKCETASGNGICTLRAAIEEANALPGADTIVLQGNVTYLLSLTAMLDGFTAGLVISDSVTIEGAGAGSTIIDGNGVSTGQGVFYIAKYIGGNAGTISLVAEMSGLTITHGAASGSADGGGILNLGVLTLDHVAVDHNTSAEFGGGIANGGAFLNGGTLTLADSRIANNSAYAGGGISNAGPMTITNSTISDNNADPASGGGGGLFFFTGGALVSSSTIEGNSALLGGGIYYSGSQSLVLVNDTISGNHSNGNGGGLYDDGGTVALYNVTVTLNLANADGAGVDVGGGIASAGSTVTATNSIIAGNQVLIPTKPLPTVEGDECAGPITLQGNNILQVVNAGCAVTGTYTTADPLLGPLQFNGGPTPTHAIGPDSPALDAAIGCTDNLDRPITTDQRGYPRPFGPACDVGAVEYDDIIFRSSFDL